MQKLTKCQVLDGGRRVEPKVSEPYIRFCIFKHSTNIIRLADLLTDDAYSANPDSEQIELTVAKPRIAWLF